MRKFCHKYTSKLILYVITFIIFMSCVRKHKFDSDKIELSNKKMTAILVDVFLMEAYVTEKMPNANMDSVNTIKRSLYKDILNKHKVDSIAFYSTFNYYQAHPDEFSSILNTVDSSLIKIKPLDTTKVIPIVNVPENIEALSNFTEQEKAMREEYLKNPPASETKESKFKNRVKKNN